MAEDLWHIYLSHMEQIKLLIGSEQLKARLTSDSRENFRQVFSKDFYEAWGDFIAYEITVSGRKY